MNSSTILWVLAKEYLISKAIKKFEPLLGGIRNIKGNNENHGYQGCLLTDLDWYLSWFFISSFNRFKLNWITGLVFNGFKNQLNVMVLFGFWFHCVGLYRIESVCKTLLDIMFSPGT